MLVNAIALMHVAEDAVTAMLTPDCADPIDLPDDAMALRSALQLHRRTLERAIIRLSPDQNAPTFFDRSLPIDPLGRLIVALNAAVAELRAAMEDATLPGDIRQLAAMVGFVLDALRPAVGIACAGAVDAETRFPTTETDPREAMAAYRSLLPDDLD
jgi:hypothetical protein